MSLGQPRTLRPNCYDVICGASSAASAIARHAGGPAVADSIGRRARRRDRRAPGDRGLGAQPAHALAPLRERYPYILIDCPPSLGPLTINALVAADRVIVPVQTEYFALEGLAQVLETIALVQRELNPRLTVAGMVLTMHDPRTRLGRDVERDVREHFPGLVFDTVIPRNIRLSEAPSFGVPVTLHDPYCAGTGAYIALARELTRRLQPALAGHPQ